MMTINRMTIDEINAALLKLATLIEQLSKRVDNLEKKIEDK